MPTPLPEAFAAILKSDPTAALAAAFIIGNHHFGILDWVARTIAPTPVKPTSKPNGATRRTAKARKAKPPAAPKSAAAYHARQRKARDESDSALLEAMRSAPDALIGDYAEAIGKSRSSTLAGLKRLRHAGLAESIEGNWRLTEKPHPHEPAPKWIPSLPTPAGRARAHA